MFDYEYTDWYRESCSGRVDSPSFYKIPPRRKPVSCDECDRIQELHRTVVDYDTIAAEDLAIPRYFIRISNSNLEVVGCEKHVTLLIDTLRDCEEYKKASGFDVPYLVDNDGLDPKDYMPL